MDTANAFTALSGLTSVFLFGAIVALLGSVKLKLAPQIQADDAKFGKLVSVFQFAMVIMAIVAGVVRDNIGFQAVIILGGIVSAVSIFLVGSSRSYGAVAAACILLGIGGQFANVGGNTLLPSLFSDPSAGSNLGNAFFGLGAFVIPMLTAVLLAKTDLRKTLMVVALIALIPTAVALFGSFPAASGSFNTDVAVSLLGNKVTWFAALTLFCYIGLEVSMAVWITSYAADLGADNTKASNTLSIFFIMMMISRLVFGLQHRVTNVDLTPNGAYVLCAAAVLSALVIAWMTTAKSLRTGRIAVGCAGFLFGPIFPTTVGVTFRHFDASQWGTLFGVIFAIGLLGSTLIPAWIGALAKGKSVRHGLRILTGTAVVLAVLGLVLGLM